MGLMRVASEFPDSVFTSMGFELIQSVRVDREYTEDDDWLSDHHKQRADCAACGIVFEALDFNYDEGMACDCEKGGILFCDDCEDMRTHFAQCQDCEVWFHITCKRTSLMFDEDEEIFKCVACHDEKTEEDPHA